MLQTDTERLARKLALHAAIDNARGADADTIVSDAEKFHAFLTGEGTK
ncbi:hypothetical protein SEA_AVOCADO_45 [Mycobacterium phage Avocado]|uniref:Uncharacterized protein n=1 Tax=Mycobacterium phage Avocado TaxID=2024302 RepID=A0A222Z0G7_9CAUD|nr:hypothetical protein KDW73_gp45 [Mycobacterium phage Avocado]ASR77246.1 hypothetical protein SEA_AVOCADO_45 [Mycobacterium phage Avocado]